MNGWCVFFSSKHNPKQMKKPQWKCVQYILFACLRCVRVVADCYFCLGLLVFGFPILFVCKKRGFEYTYCIIHHPVVCTLYCTAGATYLRTTVQANTQPAVHGEVVV